MNQPSATIPNDTSTIPPSSPSEVTTAPNSPLTNLLYRIRASGYDRRNTRGAFGGGKRRSKRHAGRV